MRLLDFGGWNPTTGQCDDSLHVLHTGRKEWNKPSINGSLPTPRHSHIACTIGTVMFIFGGQVDNYYLHDIMSFDMRTITQNAARWEKLEPQTESPPARAGHCAAVHDGRIYIFGGVDAEYFYNDIWCFDPRALTWTPIPASGYLPTGRHGHSCTVADGIMYIFGGNGPEGTELNDAYAFKIHERRWYLFQNVGPVASVRSGHTMCTIKDRIYVLGGESEQTKQEDSALIYYLEICKRRDFINASPTSPPASARPLLGGGGENTTGFVPPPPASGSNVVEDTNPYAMEAIASPPPQLTATQSVPSAAQNSYVPPPPSFSSPPNAANSPTTPSTLQPIPPGMVRTNHPLPPMSPTSPTSTSAPNLSGSDKKSGQVPPLSAGVTTPIPGPLDNAAASRASIESTTRAKALESKVDAVQEENEQLKRQLMERQGEMEKMKKRELWLMTEVILARDSLGTGKKDDGNSSLSKNSHNKRMSIMDLEKELEGGELDGQQLKITKALIKVKEELKTAKMSIATQAQAASSKIREAERVRTGALQEAAYLKAKLSSMSNADQDPGALARVEMERAADLEKRLTSALSELEILEAQYGKSQESLEQEKLSRISAEERSRGSALLAEQAQSAHTRALAEITSLHGRATKAEAESREFAAQLAEKLTSLKKLNTLSQQSASKSGAELAEAMMEISRLEQVSMQARTETISLQKTLSQERGVAAQLKSELSRTELELEAKIKEIEDHEVQLGLLKDVMREK
ncbi:MAG: hypothetical protein J3Q66DRAFT_409963, partial [Benniella sp.]